MKLWNPATGARLDTFSQPLKELFTVAFAPDGKTLAAAGADNRIRLWQVSDKAIEGITDVRDESDRDGMRIFVEIKRDANPHKVLNNLFKHTPLKLAFSANIVALVDGQPQTLPLKAILQHHIEWRREVIRRRTEFDLQKAKDRAHILEGFLIAVKNIDRVIKIIRGAKDTDEAKANMLRSKATFDEVTQTLNHTKAALKESLTLDEQKNASE
ncbi:MAG: hypothetical protein HC938_16805 [Nitrospira sp.]|nr:hypothetical protein [Nitrospira sp.]